MDTTKVAPNSATQKPFPPAAGFVQAVPDIPPLRCGGCGASPLPPAYRVCPVCGWARPGQEGAPYPAKSIERFGWVFDQRIASPTQRLVLLALVQHDMPNGRGMFPGMDRLSEMTGLSRRAVVYALKGLQADGWVKRYKVRRRGHQGSNLYVVQQPECVLAALAVDDSPPFQSARGAPCQSARGAP